jgi:squalene-hopene/tetraprenyl-beta-curcumene cyclase
MTTKNTTGLMKYVTAGMLATCILFPHALRAADDIGLAEIKQKAATVSMQKGLGWLASIQQDSGAWSNTNFPALTAMPLWAMVRSGKQELAPQIINATTYLLSSVKTSGPDKGAIYHHVPGRKGGGLSNYNTALSLVALHAVYNSPILSGDNKPENMPDLVPVILNARAFLADSQYEGETLHFGGMGYDPPTGRSYADLSNSYLGYQAMRLTQELEELRSGNVKVSLNWDDAITFIQRIHNHPEYNDQPWATDEPSEFGGFAYRPDTFRDDFGAFTNSNGVVKYRSALTMSYAGLISYLYAGVDKDDPRIASVIKWIENNWTTEKSNRNPELAGQPEEMGGYYYYLMVMSQALDAMGINELTLTNGETVNWREEVIDQLLKRQREDGYWINEYGRYWEADPTLASAYALLALQSALGM